MSTNDEREAQDSAALTAARAIYGNSFDPAVHVVQFDAMRQAARAILASLPAPGGFDWRSECEWLLGLDEIHVGEEETEVLGRIARIRAALANDSPDAGGVGEDVIERISQRIAVFADMKPEEDEDWESWYAASFDMLSAEVAALRPGLRAGEE